MRHVEKKLQRRRREMVAAVGYPERLDRFAVFASPAISGADELARN